MAAIGALVCVVLLISATSLFRSRKQGLSAKELGALPLGDLEDNLDDKEVWLGRYGSTSVACKTVTGSETELANEASTLKRLRHPNVVQCFGVASIGGHIYMVMEFISGGNLLQYLRRSNHSYNTLMGLCMSTATGVVYLHRTMQLIHRDLAARNLLLSGGSGPHDRVTVKIADVGLSRFASERGDYISMSASVAALPVRWSPPEVMVKPPRFTFASDIWSLGVVIWEILSNGAVPYEDLTSNEDVVRQVSNEDRRLPIPSACEYIDVGIKEYIQAFLMKCWDSDPEARPTAGEVHESLTNFVEGDVLEDVDLDEGRGLEPSSSFYQ